MNQLAKTSGHRINTWRIIIIICITILISWKTSYADQSLNAGKYNGAAAYINLAHTIYTMSNETKKSLDLVTQFSSISDCKIVEVSRRGYCPIIQVKDGSSSEIDVFANIIRRISRNPCKEFDSTVNFRLHYPHLKPQFIKSERVHFCQKELTPLSIGILKIQKESVPVLIEAINFKGD